jgi:hypothetical protein
MPTRVLRRTNQGFRDSEEGKHEYSMSGDYRGTIRGTYKPAKKGSKKKKTKKKH